MPGTGWFDSIKESLKTQAATWFVGLLVAVMGIFASQLTESIKSAMNKADLRTSQHEELASEISAYIFFAELNVEFIKEGWTTKTSLTLLLTGYNTSVTALRKKEFVYLAWLRKYWGSEEVESFAELMTAVREFDSALHTLNGEFESVNITASKAKVDQKLAAEALERMEPAAQKMRKLGREFLTSLG